MVESQISNINIFWAQRKRFVFLKFEARNLDPTDCVIEILKPNQIKLSGKNRLNNQVYHANIELYHDIWLDKSSYTITDLSVKFNITKKNRKLGFWPRLLKQEGKFRFLKIDWERWQDPDYIDPKNLLGENIDLEDFDDISQDSDSEKEELPEHLLANISESVNKPEESKSTLDPEPKKQKKEKNDEDEDSEEDFVPEHLR